MSQEAQLADTLLAADSDVGTQSAVRLGSLPADSAQDQRFVQDRLALLGKTTFLISSMFLVATSVAVIFDTPRAYTHIGLWAHVLATLLALGLWLIGRQREVMSEATLRGIDVVFTLGICWSFVAMGHFAKEALLLYTGLLAVTHTSILRAMVVPSTPLRSFALGVAVFAVVLLSWSTSSISEATADVSARARLVLMGALWSTAGVAVVTLASKVIYGLQAIAREARQLGQYSLEEKLGEGGMGEVYRARHAMLRRPTAVKLLRGDGNEEQLRRFEREVQMTASLTHPNTISVYDYGRTPDGVFYYAMELLDGWNLEELVDMDGPQPASRVIHILRQACGALEEAHRAGLIHRDIKPANIHLCRRGQITDFVKVLDFGLVREIRADGSASLSNVNMVVGTPLYLSPEGIVQPGKIDARADLYGLGAVAYFLVTGSPPFMGETVVEVCAHHLHTKPKPPSHHRPVPADLEAIILDCLNKDPDSRPASARKLAESLAACEDAADWSESRAGEWWNRTISVEPTPKPVEISEPRSGAQACRTVCHVDWLHRAREPRSAR